MLGDAATFETKANHCIVTARASQANVRAKGSGDVDVRAAQALDVDIEGSGDVRYHGNPALDKHDDGSGDLRLGNSTQRNRCGPDGRQRRWQDLRGYFLFLSSSTLCGRVSGTT